MSTKPTLLIFGALPPARSGTADYLQEQLGGFASEWNLVVVVRNETKARKRQDCLVLDYSSYKKRRHDFQGVPRLIHLANNAWHAHAYEESKHAGAVLLLHEFSMHHLLTETTLALGDRPSYRQELVECSPEGEMVANLRDQGVWSGIEQFLFPAIESRLRLASGVIGHSRWILDQVSAVESDLPCAHIPHHYSRTNSLDRESCRAKFGIKEGELAVVSLGFVTPAKCIDQIIRALSEIRSESPPFKFWIFGEMRHPATVRNAIKRYGMEDIVVEKGYTSMSSFEAAIEASDLVINLRYPTVGETSGTMTRAMGAGKPVVVFRHGSFSEPPADAVVGVPLDTFNYGNLATACRSLLSSQELRESIGRRASDWAASVSPAQSTQRQTEFINQCSFKSRRPEK